MHECIIDFQKIVDKNCVNGLSFQLVQIKMSVYDFLNLYFKCHVVIEKKNVHCDCNRINNVFFSII